MQVILGSIKSSGCSVPELQVLLQDDAEAALWAQEATRLLGPSEPISPAGDMWIMLLKSARVKQVLLTGGMRMCRDSTGRVADCGARRLGGRGACNHAPGDKHQCQGGCRHSAQSRK